MLHLLENNNGFVSVILLVLVSVLVILGATFASIVTFEIRNAAWQKHRTQAFYIAEAGLNRGVRSLKDDEDWTASEGATTNFPGEGEWYGLHDTTTGTDVNNVTLGDGEYSVQLCNATGGDGKAIEIKSGSEIRGSKCVIQMWALLRGWAAFGDEGLGMAGHPLIDSYNSDDGLYENQTPGENGNLGTNEDIELQGNCTVAGNATPGPDGEVRITSGQVTITGSTKSARERVYLPPPEITFSATDELKKAGLQTYTLTDGIYYFTDINFEAHAELQVNGNVTIYCESAHFTAMSKIIVNVNSKLTFYCTGAFVCTGGGVINVNKKPEDFILYSTGGYINFKGKSDFYGAVYAPNANINMGGTHDYYGSIIGRTIDSSGTGSIHHDEALADVIRIVTTASWRGGN